MHLNSRYHDSQPAVISLHQMLHNQLIIIIVTYLCPCSQTMVLAPDTRKSHKNIIPAVITAACMHFIEYYYKFIIKFTVPVT